MIKISNHLYLDLLCESIDSLESLHWLKEFDFLMISQMYTVITMTNYFWHGLTENDKNAKHQKKNVRKWNYQKIKGLKELMLNRENINKRNLERKTSKIESKRKNAECENIEDLPMIFMMKNDNFLLLRKLRKTFTEWENPLSKIQEIFFSISYKTAYHNTRNLSINSSELNLWLVYHS